WPSNQVTRPSTSVVTGPPRSGKAIVVPTSSVHSPNNFFSAGAAFTGEGCSSSSAGGCALPQPRGRSNAAAAREWDSGRGNVRDVVLMVRLRLSIARQPSIGLGGGMGDPPDEFFGWQLVWRRGGAQRQRWIADGTGQIDFGLAQFPLRIQIGVARRQ